MDRRRAFTLIELLTGLAIIALLIAMLFPAISRAQQSARLAQCASNIRQLCQGVFLYAADFGGKLPPNTSSPAMWWYDPDRIGKYIKASGVPAGEPGGPVYTCPNDDGNLSYSMNVWASCKVDADVLSYKPPTGALWLENHLLTSKLILIAEAYSWSGSNTAGWYATQAIGFAGATAGAKFGGGAGIAPPMSKGRFGLVTSELCFMRHRVPGTAGRYTQPRGVLNIGYADGHVEAKTDRDLITPLGNSSGDTLWSPADVIGP